VSDAGLAYFKDCMFRIILAFVLGAISGGVFNMLMVSVSHALYPLPPGVDPNNFESFQAHVKANGLPTGALLIVLVAHAGGSLVSGLVCGLIAMRPRYVAATILGLLWTMGGVIMLFMLPAPIWFAIADVVLYVPAALLGVKVGAAITGQTPQAASVSA
jgi:hypothetical protein